MRTPDQAQEIARSAVAQRYASAEVAFCAGSIVRGDGTPHSDIDLVVILPELKAAWRESFLHQGWPVEAFVHDATTLRYFFEEIDAKSGVPSLPQMVDEGLLVWGDQSVAETYKQLAKQVLVKGPPALAADNVRNAIYGIADLIDDLRSPRSRSETLGTAARLYEQLGDFALRSKGSWSGTGKQMSRALARQNPTLHKDFVSAFDKLFAEGNAAAVIALAERIVAPHGGLHFDGYRREAPPDWRKS
jgi:hypothetical protein